MLLLVAGAAQAQQPAAVSLAQLQRASDEELVALFFGPAATFPYVAHRSPGRFSTLSRRPSLWFYSRPRTTDRAGICRTERLTMQLERQLGSPLTSPLFRPHGFDFDPIYIVENRTEAMRDSNPTERPQLQQEVACAALDPRRHGVPADHPFQLVQALRWVAALGDGARRGRAVAPIDCSRINWNGDPPIDEAACLRELSVLREDHVGWVRNCRPRRAAAGGCLQVLTDRWWIEFDMSVGQQPTLIVVEGLEDLSQALPGPA